jgi:hypothetical protein
MAKGNITGTPFLPQVTDQINKRQQFLGENPKQDKHIIWQNNKTAFLRLASSVNIENEYSVNGNKFSDINEARDYQKQNPGVFETAYAENILKERDLPQSLIGDKLAKSSILFAGVNGVTDTETFNPLSSSGTKINTTPFFPQGLYGDTDPNSIFTAAYGWGGIKSQGYRPMPGIIGADISYYNRGALQKVTVNTKVFTIEQLQIFDLLYFRIGYTMLLEWGHVIYIDNKGDLQNRTNYFTDPFNLFFDYPNQKTYTQESKQNKIIQAIKDEREKSAYNYDAMIGKLTNFSWKFNSDGSYDITLNLIGMGDVIESLKINQAISIPGAPSSPSQDIAGRGRSIAAQQRASEAAFEAKDKELNSKTDNSAKESESIAAKQEALQKQYDDLVDNVNTTRLVFFNSIPQDQSQLAKLKKTFQVYIDKTLAEEDPNKFFNTPRTVDGIQLDVFSEGELPYKTVINNESTNNENVEYLNLTPSAATIYNQMIIIATQYVKVVEQQAKQEKSDAELESNRNKLDQEKETSEKKFRDLQRAVEAAKEKEELAPQSAKESAGKTKLNAVLWGWIDGLKTNKKIDPNNFCVLSYKAKSSNSGETGVSEHQFDQYYVRFGYLLDWITKNLLYYDLTSIIQNQESQVPTIGSKEYNALNPTQKEAAYKQQNLKNNPNPTVNPKQPTVNDKFSKTLAGKIPPLPPNAVAMFTIDTDPELNRCLSWPLQVSCDPFVCIIPMAGKDSKGNGWEFFTKNTPNLPNLSNYFFEDNPFQGKVMNIMVNIDFCAKLLASNVDVNGKVNLLKYLNELCNNINDTLGNVNKLQAIYDAEENEVKIIDDNILKRSKDDTPQVAIFKAFGVEPGVGTGKGSFLRNIDFQVQLPPNMAAMATISAQAKGNIVGENATALSKLNTGLKDRIITYKLDAQSLGGKVAKQSDSPETLFNQNMLKMYAFLKELFIDFMYQKDNVDTLRSINRDVSLYVMGSYAEQELVPAPFFIPFNMSLEMDGLSGMVNYQRFAVEESILPYSYRPSIEAGGLKRQGKIDFLIKGITHSITSNQWTTKIDSLTVSAKGQRTTENQPGEVKKFLDLSFLGNKAQQTKTTK